jgi:hypothetical protein
MADLGPPIPVVLVIVSVAMLAVPASRRSRLPME